jgi:hypothetical protein
VQERPAARRAIPQQRRHLDSLSPHPDSNVSGDQPSDQHASHDRHRDARRRGARQRSIGGDRAATAVTLAARGSVAVASAGMSTDPSFLDLPDLALDEVGGAALLCNDEFFAEKENLLKPHAAEWKDHVYTDRGKWMDGWETRRRREDGYDWCVVRLGMPGVIHGVVIDTAFFRGNYPAEASLEACELDDPLDAARAGDRDLDRAPAEERAGRRQQEPLRDRAPRPRSRTCGSTSSPTVASPACGSTAW